MYLALVMCHGDEHGTPDSDIWKCETADCNPHCRPTYVADLVSPEEWSVQLPSRKYDVVDFSLSRPQKRGNGCRLDITEEARVACHALRGDGQGYLLFSARTLVDLARLGPHRTRTAASWTNHVPPNEGIVTQQDQTDGAVRAVAEITGRHFTCERACACQPTMLLVHAPLAACPTHVHDYIRCRDAAVSRPSSGLAPTIAFRALPCRDAQAILDADRELYLKAWGEHKEYVSELHSAVVGADLERLLTLLRSPHAEIPESTWADLLEAGVRNVERDTRFVKTLCHVMKVDRHNFPAGEAVEECLNGALDSEDRCAFVDLAAYICAFFDIDDLAYYIERWKLPYSEVCELRRRVSMYATQEM